MHTCFFYFDALNQGPRRGFESGGGGQQLKFRSVVNFPPPKTHFRQKVGAMAPGPPLSGGL